MKDVTIRGANWKFEDINPQSQEVILMVHGHPFNGTMWKYQHEALSDFRLVIPDLKGYGASDSDFEKIFIEEQALDLALLLDKLHIDQVHLIGLSMGGQIIVEFQRLFPHRVKSLVLCASLPNGETEESYTNRLMLADEIETIGMLQYTKNDIHKYINLNELKEDAEPYQHLFKMMSETSAKGAVASHKGRAERRDNTKYAQTIAVPTLLIAGEQDYFFTLDSIKSFAQKLPNAQLEIIKNSGHLPNLEYPEIFNTVISKFYEKRK